MPIRSTLRLRGFIRGGNGGEGRACARHFTVNQRYESRLSTLLIVRPTEGKKFFIVFLRVQPSSRPSSNQPTPHLFLPPRPPPPPPPPPRKRQVKSLFSRGHVADPGRVFIAMFYKQRSSVHGSVPRRRNNVDDVWIRVHQLFNLSRMDTSLAKKQSYGTVMRDVSCLRREGFSVL